MGAQGAGKVVMVMVADFPETADIETSSDDYASRFAGAVGEWFLQVQGEGTLRLLSDYPGARILDVGGGHGQIAALLARHGYDVTVQGSAEVCGARIAPLVQAGQVRFDVANILDLPYPDRAFDVVISYRLLPHVERWRAFVAELARVARHAVVVDYPEVRSANAVAPLLFPVKKQMEGNTRTYTTFRRAELVEAFGEHGLQYGDRFPEFFFPMVLHRRLQQPAISAALEGASRALGLTGFLGSPVILKMVRPRVAQE